MNGTMVTIENDALRVQISREGAQLQSVFNRRAGRELLWQGDPAVWRKRAPWLFPIIGQLRGGVYRYAGREYAMPMHGFASEACFACAQQTESSAAFELTDSPQTRAVFPWRFLLRIEYHLAGAALEMVCSVRCRDEKEMYFSFGAHPGFFCAPGDRLCFEGAPSLLCQRLNARTHLLEPQTLEIPAEIELREALFDADAMLLRAPACDQAVLRRADGTGVRFTFGRVPWVGVWSRPRGGLPYVCVEPWYGVDDPAGASGELEEKRDIVRLGAGEVFTMPLRIEAI